MKNTQMIRIVEFDRLVRNRTYPNRVTFSVNYEVSERTVARDIEFIRDRLQAPLEYDTERRGYHYSEPWDLPPIVSTLNEAENRIERLINEIMKLNDGERAMVIHSIFQQAPNHTNYSYPTC